MAQRAVDNAALITTVSTLTRAANTAQFSPWPAQDLTDIDVPLNQLYRRISNKMPTFPNALFISSSNIRTPLRLRGNSSNGQPDTVGPTPPTEQTPPPSQHHPLLGGSLGLHATNPHPVVLQQGLCIPPTRRANSGSSKAPAPHPAAYFNSVHHHRALIPRHRRSQWKNGL